MRIRLPITLYVDVNISSEQRAIDAAVDWAAKVFEGATYVEGKRVPRCEVSIRHKEAHKVDAHIGPENDD